MNEFVTETKRVAKTADKEETSQRADLKFQVQEKEFGQTFPRGPVAILGRVLTDVP